MKKRINDKIKLALLWVFSFIIIILIMSLKAHAASASNTEIPYIVPNWRNANSCIPDEAISSAETRYINDVRNYFNYQGDLTYLVFVTDGIINGTTYQIFFITNPTITESYPDNYDFHNGNIKVNSNNVQLLAVNVRVSDNYVTGDAINLGTEVTLCGSSATVTLGNGYLTSRYPFLMVGTDEIKSSNDKVIFTNTAPVTIPTGHATEPINNPDNLIKDSNNNLIHKPTAPTINNYSWTTYNNPPIDTTDLQSVLESIWDSLVYNFTYLFSNLGGLFNNLINNIENFVNYIADSIYYISNNIVSAIQDFATDFYNNMVSLFEPMVQSIQDTADLFLNPFDEEEFEEQIDSCQLITRYNELLDNCEIIQQIFDETSEPDSFILYIDFENPFADSEHKIIASEINFNWLVPLRPAYRPFLTVFTLIECFVGGFRILGNIIGGKAK